MFRYNLERPILTLTYVRIKPWVVMRRQEIRFPSLRMAKGLAQRNVYGAVCPGVHAERPVGPVWESRGIEEADASDICPPVLQQKSI